MVYYSPSKNSCYPKALFEEYIKAGSLPEDLVELDSQTYLKYFLNSAPKGKVRKYSNGKFKWSERVFSKEELEKIEVSWVNSEITRTSVEIEKILDGYNSDFSSETDVRKYRKELREYLDSGVKEKKNRPNPEKYLMAGN